MKTIQKYVLRDVVNEISTFEGVKFVHVANQHESITVWGEVQTLERECMAFLHVLATGHEVPTGAEYLGSAVMAGGDFVFHVYEGRR